MGRCHNSAIEMCAGLATAISLEQSILRVHEEDAYMFTVERVTVLGSGRIGPGIAQVAAQIGKFDVTIFAQRQDRIENGIAAIQKSLQRFVEKKLVSETEKAKILNRIHGTLNLKAACANADLVIEAITEDVEAKKRLLREVDALASSRTLITSNTSSIRISELSSVMRRPKRFCGLHFFHPPQLNRLVEVTGGDQTSSKTIDAVLEIAKKMGKESVLLKKDSPGFIVNRILVPALNAAADLYAEDVAERNDIDRAVKLGLNWPMGPLELIDYIGADIVLQMGLVLENELGQNYRPSPVLKQLVKDKCLGRKTGKGFYDWNDPQVKR